MLYLAVIIGVIRKAICATGRPGALILDPTDYDFDMSANPARTGTIRALRVDPLESAGRDIAVDRVRFPTA